MKYIVVTLAIGTLLLMGCSSAMPPASTPPPLPTPEIPEREVVVTPSPVKVEIEIEGAITAIPATYELSDKGAVGFEPGKYDIGNFAPGKEADLPITLHSNRDEPVSFLLSYRTPSYTREGYALAPEITRDWLSFDTTTPTLKVKERLGIVAILSLPEDAEVPDKWEFWIAIKEAGQTSQVQTEGCLRVFVNMR